SKPVVRRGFTTPSRQPLLLRFAPGTILPTTVVRSMDPVSASVARWLIRWRGGLAVVAVALVVVSVAQSRRLEFVRSIDTMFDRTDPALVPYRRMIRAFGSSEVVLAAYDDPELFTSPGIDRLRGFADRIRGLPGVASATSLADTPLGGRVIDTEGSPAARRFVDLLEGYAVGADHPPVGHKRRVGAIEHRVDRPHEFEASRLGDGERRHDDRDDGQAAAPPDEPAGDGSGNRVHGAGDRRRGESFPARIGAGEAGGTAW
ncbi:MAG: hypothetical protein ACKOTB_03595, partial [Planctomycetia bacterium]